MKISAKAGPKSRAPVLARAALLASRPVLVQRMSDATNHAPAANPMTLIDRALPGPAARLDANVRAFMEPRFGEDFSQVRVHADAASASAAHALSARAFTIGDDVFFGAGQYSPTSGAGRRMLAHELTHVVQQRTGPVDAVPGLGGVNLSDPGDRFERAAEAKAEAVMASKSGAPPIAARQATAPTPRAAGPGAVQRFLAGEAGHGGIEEDALQEAGFSRDEAHQTYYGNWLRDFSQLLDTKDEPKMRVRRELINILATGEFGRAPSDEELGHYLASEHVDNPEGGESAEAPLHKGTAKAVAAEQKTQADRRAHLSKSQQAWFDQEQDPTFKDHIRDEAKKTGLPAYIEVAKAHVRNQLAEAAALGRNRDGEQALGNGLHAVEDYFAHSNFIEVALRMLADERAIDPANPLVRALGGYYKVQPDKVGKDRFGRPAIITGTSVKGPGDDVGKMEALKAELGNGEIRALFLKGAAIRYGWKAPRAGGRWLFGKIGGGLGGAVGGVLGAVGGLLSGAASGAATGWRGGKGWRKPFAAIGGLFKGAALGAGRGAESGAKAGWRAGEKAGGAVGDVIGGAVGVVLTPALFAVLYPFYLALNLGLGVAENKLMKVTRESISKNTAKTTEPKTTEPKTPEAKTTDAKTPAQKPPDAKKPDPKKPPGHKEKPLATTHSQIAKDDIEQPLHFAAAELAHDADVAFGKMMLEVWAHKQPVSAVQKLVDTYMVHPKANPWWRPTLIKAATAKSAPGGKDRPSR